MTTIAYDGTTLAADTQATNNTMPFKTCKLWRLKDGRLFGGDSDLGMVLLVRNWLNDGGEKPKIEKEVGFSGILIDLAGTIWRLDSYLLPQLVEAPFHACGSGRDFAMAAMHLGKTASEAVEVAKLFCVYTGGPVQTLTLENKS